MSQRKAGPAPSGDTTSTAGLGPDEETVRLARELVYWIAGPGLPYHTRRRREKELALRLIEYRDTGCGMTPTRGTPGAPGEDVVSDVLEKLRADVIALPDVNPTPTVQEGRDTDWPMVRRAAVVELIEYAALSSPETTPAPEPTAENRIEAALQQAAARVSAALFGLVSDEVFEAVQRDILDDPAVAAPLRRRR